MDKLIFSLILGSSWIMAASLNIKVDESGDCSCGVFPSDSADSILVQTLQFKVACSQDGYNKCQQICTVLVNTGSVIKKY